MDLPPPLDWDAKLRAFLHDPPHKAVCLAQRVGHEEQAEALADAVGVAGAGFQPTADHLASAADRPRGLEDAAVDWLAEPLITRPTGGVVGWTRADLRASVGGLAARQLTEEISEILGSFAGLDPRRRFLATWRLLPLLLPRPRSGRPQAEAIGPWWRVLPADTRVPDHGIWAHARMVSAFQGALGSPTLLELRLGPVQDFIRGSRRTRDLWASSWLLSYLAGVAAWSVATEAGPDAIVFPDLHGQPLVDLWLRRELAGVPGAELLRERLPSTASFPNRLVALLDAARAEILGRAAVAAAQQRFQSLVRATETRAASAAARAGMHADRAGWSEHWERVVEHFPAVSWVAVQLPSDAGEGGFEELLQRAGEWGQATATVDTLRHQARVGSYTPNIGFAYPAAYALLQAASGARRAVRTFGAWDGEGERCTVCGERPALPIADRSSDRVAQIAAWRAFAEALRAAAGSIWVGLDGREMTCGLCLVRRALPEVAPEVEGAAWDGGKPRFPSTGSVASAPWRRSVEDAAETDPGLARAVEDLVEAAEAAGAAAEIPSYESPGGLARLDGRVLLVGEAANLADEYGEHAASLKEVAASLRRVAAERGLGAPSGYFAVLAMDGDHMGRWLSGGEGTRPSLAEVVHPGVGQPPSGEAAMGPSRHAGISATLRDFGLLGVPGIVREAGGALVYAGGDDVLAFLPLKDLLGVARRLRVGFSDGGAGDGRWAWVPTEQEDQARPDRPPPDLDYWVGTGRITASIGIAIAHHMSDLRTVVEAAKEMEATAKDLGGRDALAIAVLKRSGERLEAVCPWSLGDRRPGPAVVDAWRAAFAQDGISVRILRDLQGETAVAALGSEEALARRVWYLLERHGGSEQHGQLVDGLLGLWRALQGRGWSPQHAWCERGCVQLLAVAAFLAREGHA